MWKDVRDMERTVLVRYVGLSGCCRMATKSTGDQYPLFPVAAPGVVRSEMADPHERLSVRAAACVTNASGDVVLMVAASDLPWVLDRGRVETRGYSVVKSLPMQLPAVPPATGAFLMGVHQEVIARGSF